ncbi:MAG TPA: hypothetical protein VJN96_02490 [Vicinamibacterales bacterium]|nr:hypothetical protein [Vicinamibacterales bacterium]
MSEALGFAGYVVVKYAAYAWWCYIGLVRLAPDRATPVRKAAVLGAFRLALGIGVGLFIYVAALSMNNATRNAPLTYAAIYVPVRVLEWTLLHVFVAKRFQWPASVGWVLGGVIVSCLADVPLGMMNGGVVPVGRPFC